MGAIRSYRPSYFLEYILDKVKEYTAKDAVNVEYINNGHRDRYGKINIDGRIDVIIKLDTLDKEGQIFELLCEDATAIIKATIIIEKAMGYPVVLTNKTYLEHSKKWSYLIYLKSAGIPENCDDLGMKLTEE